MAQRSLAERRTAPAVPGAAPERSPGLPPSSSPARRPRRAERSHREQALWLLLILSAASLCAILGLAYLSSYARLTYEGYRHHKLVLEMHAEQDRARRLNHLKAQLSLPDVIERKALDLHMVRAQESEAVTLTSTGTTGL